MAHRKNATHIAVCLFFFEKCAVGHRLRSYAQRPENSDDKKKETNEKEEEEEEEEEEEDEIRTDAAVGLEVRCRLQPRYGAGNRRRNGRRKTALAEEEEEEEEEEQMKSEAVGPSGGRVGSHCELNERFARTGRIITPGR